MTDTEQRLRALWTAQGVPEDRQQAMIADIAAKAQPGAQVGPFRVPATDQPTLFALQADKRPKATRRAADRYREPSLF